jgi:hypothetical protein
MGKLATPKIRGITAEYSAPREQPIASIPLRREAVDNARGTAVPLADRGGQVGDARGWRQSPTEFANALANLPYPLELLFQRIKQAEASVATGGGHKGVGANPCPATPEDALVAPGGEGVTS